jgi:hypothetical protein
MSANKNTIGGSQNRNTSNISPQSSESESLKGRDMRNIYANKKSVICSRTTVARLNRRRLSIKEL